MVEKNDLPFTPDKNTTPSAKAGKYGIGYSTVKHLARMALKRQQEKKKMAKEEVELDEEGFSPRGHRLLATHHFNKAKELIDRADSAENRGDSYGADHLNDVAGKHMTAYRAHKEASTDPKKSAEAHKASHEANDMIVDESVELEEGKYGSFRVRTTSGTFGGPKLPRRSYVPQGDQDPRTGLPLGFSNPPKSEKPGDKEPKKIKEEKASRTRADIEKEIEHHRKQIEAISNSSPGNHPQASLQRRRMARPHVKKKEALEKELAGLKEEFDLHEEVEQIDEISLKDRLAGKTAPVVKSKYNRSKANRPMTGKELEAHNRSKALDFEKMPKPDHAKDYTIKHKSSHTEEGELEDATYHNYDILHKGKKVGTHHYADYFGSGTTTIHGHKEYDTGYIGNTERLHHYMKTKTGFRNVFGKKEGEQKHAEYVAKHGIKKYATEEVEHLDEISAGLAKKVAQARDKSAVDYDLTPTQSRRLKMGDKGGDPDMNAAKALKSAMKRGAKNVYGEEVELDEAMRHEIAGQIARFIGNKIDPVHGDIMHMHGKEAYRQAAYHIRKTVHHVSKAVSDLHDQLHKHLRTGAPIKLKLGEEIELDEVKVKMPKTTRAYKEYTRLTGKTPEQRISELDKVQKDLEKQRQEYIRQGIIKEGSETEEKREMAATQAHFIQYAAKEIIEYINMGGEIEEWYQNKLSKVHSDVEGLHSWIEGEKRRTGMVKEEEEMKEAAVHPMGVHVSPSNQRKDGRLAYKVHAVGKHLSDGLKAGEHLTDTELDDLTDIGAKIKHIKEGKSLSQILEMAKRGRPRKNPAEPAKKKSGDDDEEDDTPDVGPEADQNITVHLKKTMDNEKHVTNFSDGGKHVVPQHVAQTIHDGMMKLKPEQRKQVQDHIQQSHKNLMDVHAMLKGR